VLQAVAQSDAGETAEVKTDAGRVVKADLVYSCVTYAPTSSLLESTSLAGSEYWQAGKPIPVLPTLQVRARTLPTPHPVQCASVHMVTLALSRVYGPTTWRLWDYSCTYARSYVDLRFLPGTDGACYHDNTHYDVACHIDWR
jgi:hypothetical protein